MKHGIHILFWMLIAALSSCTDDEIIDVPEPQPQTGIVIRLSTGDLEQTRTDLTSQANLHHVQSVYAILYKENADKSDYDYVTCDDLNWSPKDSSSYGEAQAQAKVLDLPNDINLEAGNYTVLCVGLDDKSGDTYGLTPENMQSFKTLSKAKATLAGGKTKDDIAKSELFAGWNQFHFAPDSLNIVDVEMKRRVAGVLCYLTDVPYQLTQDNKTYRITSVELWLYTKQNTGIKLCREEITGGEYPEDFGDTSGGDLEGSELIGQQSMINSGFGVNTDKTLYTRDRQTITTTDGREVTIKENSILMGAYLIPIDYDETKSTITDANLKKDVTLQVALRGVEVASIDEGITDEKIKGAQIVRSFPAFNDDIDLDIDNSSGTPVATPSYTYPIRPNIIYHIGNKPSDEEEGTPESLAGTKVNIVAEEWTNQEINVEFPSVPIMATMELLDEKGQPYNTDSYVFDCIGTDEVVLEITNSVMNNPWELDAIGEGFYFRSKEGNSYSKEYNATDEEYESKNPIKVHVLITDYAEKRDYTQIDWKKDIRTTLVKLTAKSSSGDVEYSLNVKQYNAINVIMKDNDNQEQLLGFSRFDWGTIRNSSGVITTDGTPHTWGFDGWTVRQITGTDIDSNYAGYLIYNYAIQQAEKDEDYAAEFMPSSALYLAGKDKIEGINGNLSTTGLWYLPASYELEAFLNFAKAEKDDSHVKVFISDTSTPHNKYFTSNPRYSHRVWSYYIDTKNDVTYAFEATGDNRTDSYYMRQCCRIKPCIQK